MVCNSCIRTSNIASMHDGAVIEESNDSVANIEVEDEMVDFIFDQEVSRKDLGDLRSPREIDLEGMSDDHTKNFVSLPKFDALKLRILTIAPSSSSERQIASECGATRTLVKKSENLKTIHGILAETTLKSGKELPVDVTEKVIEFYNSDVNGRIMPGIKNCVTMMVNGQKARLQKRIILMDLQDWFVLFKELLKKSQPKMSIGFSSFCRLRPKDCILPGASGTHSVCVCTIHQNVKLMLDAINIGKLTEDRVLNYKDCLNEMICSKPTNDCCSL